MVIFEPFFLVKIFEKNKELLGKSKKNLLLKELSQQKRLLQSKNHRVSLLTKDHQGPLNKREKRESSPFPK